ncbi:type II toxin-antitoxin system VapC family toxin [Aeoliella sp.]|uniref:type II toxin-antitoxin system VapC family toxin n=1 Tax=Aeoliella sp. TaxID=2795800 RepID=UPI003CCBE557
MLDASAILPLALPNEDATYSNAVLCRIGMDELAYVPPIFWDELLNVLVLGVRRGRIDLKVAEAFLLKASFKLPIITTSPRSRLEVLRIAHDYGLTSYDATYLSLAIELEADIATHDKALADAAKRAGLVRYEPGERKATA